MPSLLADNLDFLVRDKYMNKGISNVTGQDVGNFAKGAAVSPFTVAPDLLGMLFNAGNAIRAKSDPDSVRRGVTPFPQNFSGDVIRKIAGTDNPAGFIGELFDPTATSVKGVGVLADATRFIPDVLAKMPDGLLGMTLFHGTPHKFNKFSLDTIGTGEGAQAFGHGLYFAENKGVAESYQNSVGSFSGLKSRADNAGLSVAEYQKKVESGELSIGSLYEVEIPDDITAKMLDWDAPLSDQPDIVQRGLQRIVQDAGGDWGRVRNTKWNGEDFYRRWLGGDSFGGSNTDVRMSETLNDAGIPGIRFFDASSRGAGEGTRNIVVFNPDDITQVKRDGELVFENKLGIGL